MNTKIRTKHNHIIYIASFFVSLLIAGNIFALAGIFLLEKRVDNLSEDLAKLILLTSDEIGESLEAAEDEVGSDLISEITFVNSETDTLTASIPADWSMTENDSATSANELFGNVEGVSSVSFKNEIGELVMQMIIAPQPLSEVSDLCEAFFQFPDYNPLNLQSASTAWEDQGQLLETVEVEDFGSYQFLGTDIRRFQSFFFYDTDATQSTFETQCPGSSEFMRIPTSLTYTADGVEDNKYTINIIGQYSKSEYSIFDTILESLEVK